MDRLGIAGHSVGSFGLALLEYPSLVLSRMALVLTAWCNRCRSNWACSGPLYQDSDIASLFSDHAEFKQQHHAA